MSKCLRRHRQKQVFLDTSIPMSHLSPSRLPYKREKASRQNRTTGEKLLLQTQVSWHHSQLKSQASGPSAQEFWWPGTLDSLPQGKTPPWMKANSIVR